MKVVLTTFILILMIPYLTMTPRKYVCRSSTGNRLSTPQVQRLLLHVPWLLRWKRDCTPALFFTPSVSGSTLSPCSSEEEGLAHSLPPHNGEEFSGGGGIGLSPHNSGVYFGRGGTGPLPHNVGACAFDNSLSVVQCRLFVDKIELGY